MAWPATLAAVGQGMGGAGQMAGGLAGIYGTYKGLKLQEDQFKEDKERYRDELMRMREMDALSKQQLNLGNLGTFQQLAQGQEDRLQDMYGSYNRMIGK